MTKQVLGKGFDGLIPTGFDIDTVAVAGESVRQIAITKLYANPDQPRKYFDEKQIRELANSIKHHGIIQPLVVTPDKDKYRIVAGERRYRASQLAGLEKIPVIIRNHEELEELEISLVENVQRVDLSPLETAVSIVKLRDQFSLSIKEIAAKLGKAESTVTNIIRLLQLPKEAVESLQKNKISEGHARAILSLRTDQKAQKDLLNKIVVQKMTVRQAELYAQNNKTRKVNKNAEKISANIQDIIDYIEKKSGKEITVQKRKKGGIVLIRYSQDRMLLPLLNKLKDNL